jgi:hypothetical protein
VGVWLRLSIRVVVFVRGTRIDSYAGQMALGRAEGAEVVGWVVRRIHELFHAQLACSSHCCICALAALGGISARPERKVAANRCMPVASCTFGPAAAAVCGFWYSTLLSLNVACRRYTIFSSALAFAFPLLLLHRIAYLCLARAAVAVEC